MSHFESFIFGVIQGLTEFLPISSSGHLALFKDLFSQKSDYLLIIILAHGGTLFAVLSLFRKEILSLFSFKIEKNKKILARVFVATLPILILGIFIDNAIRSSLDNKWLLSLGFFSTGLFLLASRFFTKKNSPQLKIEEMSLKQAFQIGIFQLIALFPGFSRSGWTITSGLLFGLSPKTAVYFSFLISLPAVAGALFLETFKIMNSSYHSFSSLNLLVVFISSYISGIFFLYFLLKITSKQKLYLFSYYLIPLSLYLILF